MKVQDAASIRCVCAYLQQGSTDGQSAYLVKISRDGGATWEPLENRTRKTRKMLPARSGPRPPRDPTAGHGRARPGQRGLSLARAPTRKARPPVGHDLSPGEHRLLSDNRFATTIAAAVAQLPVCRPSGRNTKESGQLPAPDPRHVGDEERPPSGILAESESVCLKWNVVATQLV